MNYRRTLEKTIVHIHVWNRELAKDTVVYKDGLSGHENFAKALRSSEEFMTLTILHIAIPD
jgi:hypothetical protein